jgi:hypothetical protein
MTSLASTRALGSPRSGDRSHGRGYFFISSVSDGQRLGVLSSARVGAVGYQMTVLVEQVGAALIRPSSPSSRRACCSEDGR